MSGLPRSIHTDTRVGHVIQTRYGGYKFRSRLEARWAVFFDALKIEYEYEPEGFDIDGKWYLPDFRLHLSMPINSQGDRVAWQVWVECKPITERQWLDEHLSLLVKVADLTGAKEAMVVCGPPNLILGNSIARYSHFPKDSPAWQWIADEITPGERTTLAYRRAMEERFDGKAT